MRIKEDWTIYLEVHHEPFIKNVYRLDGIRSETLDATMTLYSLNMVLNYQQLKVPIPRWLVRRRSSLKENLVTNLKMKKEIIR